MRRQTCFRTPGVSARLLAPPALPASLSFGGARLPKLARSLGQAQKEFKEGLSEESDDDDNA